MAAHLLFKLSQFRENGEFIDVRLRVDESIFPAHRNVLAANSDYFHAMFTNGMKESNQEVIEPPVVCRTDTFPKLRPFHLRRIICLTRIIQRITRLLCEYAQDSLVPVSVLHYRQSNFICGNLVNRTFFLSFSYS